MKGACFRRAGCRLCGREDLAEVLSLVPTPPANAFVSQDALDTEQAVYPLDVFFCIGCGHVQLLDVVDPRVLFENYVYVSGTSPVFVEHLRSLARSLKTRYPPDSGTLAIDIGSNDGTLLRFFKNAGLRVLGIDPALEIARQATASGIPTIAEFLTPTLAEQVVSEHGPAHFITANNVYAHVNELAALTESIRRMLAAEGVFSFEVSYLVDVYEHVLFDTIYHEHLDYHSVGPLQSFLAAHDMELFSVERIGSHGGSLRGFVQHRDGPHKADGSVESLIDLERRLKLDQPETLMGFGEAINSRKQELISLLSALKSEGKRIAGFGAPAKATTLMYHFGIGPEVIDFIVDDSPLKQNLFSPGLHVPVVSSDRLYSELPEYVVILAWNFAEPIIANHGEYSKRGGKFIIPLPEVRVT
ncbi:MAG: class I SAM-dependent methyltransferase [Acidobacteriota bacterium]|nr:class I SAM-dependent methyltransferase [Acidobacteriota bacterium]